jgi:hypothetical protein
VGGRHHPTALLSHQRGALGDPRVDDELARVALQLAHDRVDRHPHAGYHGLHMRVDQRGQLVAITTTERTRPDQGHERTSTRMAL